MLFSKEPLPQSLNICLVGQKVKILSRKTDHGFVWPIARGLTLAGHKVTVISTKSPVGKPELTRDGVQAFYLLEGIRNTTNMDFKKIAYRKISELHSKNKFHIIHSLDDSALPIAQNKKSLGLHVAFDVEATHLSRLFSILGRRRETLRSQFSNLTSLSYEFLVNYFSSDRQLLKNSDGIFVTNPQQRIILERYFLYPDYHMYSVPYGIDVGDLSPKDQSQDLKTKLGLSLSSQIAVTISDMTDKDEMTNILRAFEKVAIKKPNAHLIMIGYGPAFKKIEFEMLSLALGSRVTMTGALSTDEVFDYILLGDVFIDLSSKSTGFEPTLIEAMAQNKIIIGSEVSPMVNVVENGVDGFLLRPADTESLTQLILSIFNGAIPRQEIGERARAKVINMFDAKRMVEGMMDAYHQILVKSGKYRRPATIKKTSLISTA
ncbi:MAG: glycosyltransferase family 4 protein [Pseudobdellovibrionaceae bacterium]